MKSDGTRETWDETVRRVVQGNLSLVPRDRIWQNEEQELYDLIYNFRAIPGGRHLWMSGVEGRQFLFNCYVSGWGDRLSEHFTFTFNQLMEGGGVGANYSDIYVGKYSIDSLIRVHIVCDDRHENYSDLLEAGLLSHDYVAETSDAFVVEDSREGWTAALRWVIDIAENGSYEDQALDLVIDVSNVRAAGKRIKTFGGTSAGPVPFARMMKEISHLLVEAYETGFNGPLAMEMDHAIATCVVSGNVRRSARMSIMRWDDPFIEWFLKCKEEGLGHWSTNISVEIDNNFIRYLSDNSSPESESDIQARNKARKVYKEIIAGMLRNGEPGIWNSSLANVGEPNRVIATNPCGEICLEPWENCNLGHINLDSFVNSDGAVDLVGLQRAHELMARFLIRATFGDISDPKTRSTNDRNRRIGVGHFGYAGFVAKQGIRFSQSHKDIGVHMVLMDMKDIVQKTIESYAHELRIPVPVKSTTIAPTGTIAKLAGRTEGIHPVYARYFIQRIRFSTVDESQNRQIEEYRSQGYNVVPDVTTPYTMVVEIPTKNILVDELEALGIDANILEDASEISLEDHLSVQQMYQTYWADNAISYTVNLDPKLHNEDSLAKTLLPFLGTLKGTTIFPERGYELAPMERVGEEDFVRLRASQGPQNSLLGDGVDEECATGACPVR